MIKTIYTINSLVLVTIREIILSSTWDIFLYVMEFLYYKILFEYFE